MAQPGLPPEATIAAFEDGAMSPALLTRILLPSGVLPAGGSVAEVVVDRVGTGQVARTFRAGLAYAEGPSGPSSVIFKVAADDDRTRRTAQKCGWYRREVCFYEDFAAALGSGVPAMLHAAISDDDGTYLLVLEDLATGAPGDQLAGCSPEVTALVLERIATLHASRWGDPELGGLEWLNVGGREWPAFARRVPRYFDTFREQLGDRLAPEALEAGEQLSSLASWWFGDQLAPWTLQHGDLRPDNIMFGPAGSGRPVVLLDWQSLILGPALVDVAYFLGGGLTVADRRAHEGDLVRHYHDVLCALGVERYDFDRCWSAYRWASMYGWFMSIGSAATVGRTERGDEMFATMAERHAIHAADLEAAALAC